MSENFTYEQIEAYLLQQMTKTERSNFESALKTDSNLAQQFEQQKLEHKMMESLIEKDLRKDLDKWKKEDNENVVALPTKNAKQVSIFRNRRVLAIAASLALLIAAFLWMNREKSVEMPIVEENKTETPKQQIPTIKEEIKIETPQNENIANNDPVKEDPIKKEEKPVVVEPPKTNNYIALADTYYEPTDFGSINVRGDETDIATAIEDLKVNNFEEGLSKLAAINTADDKNLLAHYYTGLAYYNQKNFAKVISSFEKLNQPNSSFLYIDEVQWLLALAYLQTNKSNKAKTLLQAIAADEDHPRFKKAVELLNNIN